MHQFGVRSLSFVLPLFLTACAALSAGPKVHMSTQRETPYYLSTEADQVQDTCPGHDILKPFNCTPAQPDGLSCFDVYMVQGSPAPQQRYTLLQQTLQPTAQSPQPPCPDRVADCPGLLQALQYNLEFSWYVVNFPSSSFAACGETYDCKRVDCFIPPAEEQGHSTRLSCVYKKNQLFFVGAEVTCRAALR